MRQIYTQSERAVLPASSAQGPEALSADGDTVRAMDSVRITTAFIPVADPVAAARWYSRVLGFQVHTADAWSAVLRSGEGDEPTSLTLMGPASGIQVKPGLAWATCNFAVSDLSRARSELQGYGCDPSAIDGTPEICLFFTIEDPDGNTLLVTDR
jgi:catechol 2,3-dioxygenase-like lactoylglutathione lyase family enzyme